MTGKKTDTPQQSNSENGQSYYDMDNQTEYGQTTSTQTDNKDNVLADTLEEEIQKTSKSGGVFWYPVQNMGNRPDLEGAQSSETGKSSCDLERYGAYHFQIYYFPEKQKEPAVANPNSAVITADSGTAREAYLNWAGSKNYDQLKGGGEVLKSMLGLLADLAYAVGYSTAGTIGLTFQTGTSFLVHAQYVGSQEQANYKDGNKVLSSPMLAYKGLDSQRFDIYLPLRNYVVNRSSGIAENKDVISDMGTMMSKNIYNSKVMGFAPGIAQLPSAINAGDVANVTNNATGSTVRDFVAPRVNSPSLENPELSWELVPRSQKEMDNILNILKCFQYLSIPNFNKKDFFYVMPPVMFMEALTYDFTKNKTRNLRPKFQYYITNINMTFSATDSGEMLLTPEGYPMYIILKLNLLKSELASAQDLFANPFM